jgi:hypothetical protein
MMIPDGDIDALAQHMIKAFPSDAADRAAMRSNAFFVLGYREKSEKWLRVREQIKKIQGQTQEQWPSGTLAALAAT